jgi:putative endonuclease
MSGGSVYILRCADSSYYTGVTRREVEQRVAEHNEGVDRDSYTFSRRPVKLVYSQHFDRIDEAIASERRIKGWSRMKKEALIRGDFGSLPGLASRKGSLRHVETVCEIRMKLDDGDEFLDPE